MEHHDHGHDLTGGRLRTAFFLTLLILAVEIVGAIVSRSLSLLSDAGHVLTDTVALGLAWFAAVQATRPANADKTYGYHRIGILAALLNATMLIIIVLAIAVEAIVRLRHPVTVEPTFLFPAAVVGIAINLFIGFGLRGQDAHNLNVRAATLHVFGDVAVSAGVIVAGAVMVLTRWYLVDPLLSIVIAVLIARGAWNVLLETVDILMESAPRGMNVEALARDMSAQPGIRDVHDLHVWSVAGGVRVLSAHVQVDDGPLSERDRLVGGTTRMLHDRYGIGHATIQLECAGCESQTLYCEMQACGDDCHCYGDEPHPHMQAVSG
jgi:cobalt-zinc-cadmium efflux system protein